MKKTLALILSLALALSSMTVGVFAEAEGSQPADPAVNVLDESTSGDQEVQGGDVVTEKPEATSEDIESGQEESGSLDNDQIKENNDSDSEQVEATEEDVESAPLEKKDDALDPAAVVKEFFDSVSATPVDSTSAKIKWTWPAGDYVASVKVGSNDTITDKGVSSSDVKNLPAGTTSNIDVSFTITEANGETLTEPVSDSKPVSVTLQAGKITNLATYSAYKSIALEWDKFPGAASYKVYRTDGKVFTVNKDAKAYDSDKRFYIDKTGDESEKTYSYYVTAVGVDGKEIAKSDTKSDASVKQLYIKATFKKTRKLKSHDKAKKKRTFKKGTTVYCHSFKFGKYIFYDDKGHLYYCNYMSLKKFKALTAKGAPLKKYSDKEAEYFVQTANKGSSTNYTIWANLYSQHLYVLTRANKNSPWRVAKNLQYKKTKAYDWKISSGKADTPSPAGMSFKLKKHKKTQRGVKWLTFYHSQTSLHGKVGNQSFNTLRSGGCIRNPDKYAQLIYKKIPLKTRLIVY